MLNHPFSLAYKDGMYVYVLLVHVYLLQKL